MKALGILLCVGAACGSNARSNADLAGDIDGSSGTDGGQASDAPTGPSGALSMLSLDEAPAATERLFWGTLNATAPGFAVSSSDQLTIGLGADNGLRYLRWQTLPSLQKTYGDGAHDFPTAGTRAVDLRPDFAIVFDEVNVLDAPAPTATHFLLSSHYISTGNACDFIESIEGTKSGDGWSVVYSEQGTLYGAAITATGTGIVYPRDPNARVAPLGSASVWSAPVEIVAPGFAGPPVDHLTLALDGTGRIEWFSFQNFVRRVSFTGTTNDLPAGGTIPSGEGTVSYDSVVTPTLAHVVIRYHVVSSDNQNDFTEGFDSTRKGDSVVVRYFIFGTLRGAAIDAHAAGSLTPVASSGVDGGTPADGGAGADGTDSAITTSGG